MTVEELFDRAREDPLAAWQAAAIAPGDLEVDPLASSALAAVLAGAAARAVELCAGDPQDTDFQRRFGAICCHANAAEILARRDGAGLELAALARQSMRYSWSAIELALQTARSPELEAIAHAALRLLCDPLRPADETLDRALARERLSV